MTRTQAALTAFEKFFRTWGHKQLARATNKWKDTIADLLRAERQKRQATQLMARCLRHLLRGMLSKGLKTWVAEVRAQQRGQRETERDRAMLSLMRKAQQQQQQIAVHMLRKVVARMQKARLSRGMGRWQQQVDMQQRLKDVARLEATALEAERRHALGLVNAVVCKLRNGALSAAYRQWLEVHRAEARAEEQKRHAASLVVRTVRRMTKGMVTRGWNGWWAAVYAQREAEEAALHLVRATVCALVCCAFVLLGNVSNACRGGCRLLW